jgi:hypothetical protein
VGSILPKRIGNVPDTFTASAAGEFLGEEFQLIFPGTPTKITRVSVIFTDPNLQDVQVDLVIKDFSGGSHVAESDRANTSYIWSGELFLGPNQYLGIETDGMVGGGAGEIVGIIASDVRS